MWQDLREELHSQGFELVTVGLDNLGAEGCRAYIEAAAPTHPALIDRQHVLVEKFGVINIPQAIWIDENGMIVRPAETAPAPPSKPPNDIEDFVEEGDAAAVAMPERFVEMMTEASKFQSDAAGYHSALLDWVAKGSDSEYALSPEETIARSHPRDANISLGHAHFELASALEIAGDHKAAIDHFRRAHELVPDSWTFRRQAWSLENNPVDGPLSRFWQGPSPDAPEDWPYAGDWLSDVRKVGPENYSETFQP